MSSFSVVIPTRNRPHFLKEAISSVLAQSLRPRDIIVVDDGEGAREALKGLSEEFVVLDNRQHGPVAARNLGVSSSTSDVIAFLDDDDWWTDQKYLEKATCCFDTGSDFSFGDGKLVFDNGAPDLPFSFDASKTSLERDNTILISAVCYRRSLHFTLGAFDETLPYYWDWDWYLRIARSGAKFAHIAEPVAAIRVHSQNMSGESLEAERRANLDLMTQKHRLPPIPLKNHLSLAQEKSRCFSAGPAMAETHGRGSPES